MSSKSLFFSGFAGRPRLFLFAGAIALGVLGCGGGTTDPDTDDLDDPDANLVIEPGFMVGDWSADSLVMTSRLNSEVVADLIALGATFTLLVEPSGRYTAILEGYGQSSSEIGRLTIDGPDVVTLPQSPPGSPSRAVWERVGDNVILVGPSLFDFNLDGSAESAILRQVLSPRSD